MGPVAQHRQQGAFTYLKGAVDILGTVGTFPCRTPITNAVLAQSAARIAVGFQETPQESHTWKVFSAAVNIGSALAEQSPYEF
jgi:hypothetical protein